MDPAQFLQSTADAAFATGEEGRIVIWNDAAQRLLGYKAGQVLGRPCHQVLCGKDVYGNRFCDRECNLARMAVRKESVRRFEMDVRKASGDFVRVGVSVLTIPGSGNSRGTIVHILQPVAEGKESDTLTPRHHHASQATATAPSSIPLTRREIEVLRRLAAGSGTREIAASMFISVATARTHIQNILRKLEVHSKLAAVSLAIRKRLI